MKRHTAFTLLVWGTMSASSALPARTGHAHPADTTQIVDIEEVVIVATPKENSRLRQQAIAATSFSQSDMRRNNVSSVKSLSELVPNLFIPDYGSKLTTSVYIRGIGSRINTSAVGLYVDNIPFIDKSAFDFNYADVERIDVMRGPQGTLYGRNTMGGLIRIFTKSPFAYQGTDVRLGAASYNDYKASLTHYHRVSPRFAFSVGLFYGHNGGFFRNSFDSRRIDTGNEAGGRIRAIYLPSENLKLDFTVNYEFLDQGGYPYFYAGRTAGEENRREHIGKIAYNHPCGYRRSLANAGLNIEHQAGSFTVSSATGFQYLRDRMDLDQDFTEQNIYTMLQKQRAKTLTEEIVLKSKPGSRWQWTTGASGFYQWFKTDAPVSFHEDGIAQMIEGNVNPIFEQLKAENPKMPDMYLDVTDNNFTVGGTFDTPTASAALYHQSTLSGLFTDELSLTAGIRLEYEKYWIRYRSGGSVGFDFRIPQLEQIPGFPSMRGLQAAPLFEGKLATGHFRLLPKVALEYNFSQGNQLYASVSKGYRSGGYNIQMFSDLIQGDMMNRMIATVDEKSGGMVGKFAGSRLPHYNIDVEHAIAYRPEYAWNYEVGSHLTLAKGRLQADLSLFYMDTHDQQLSRFAENGMGRITVNAGKSRSMGAEASLRAQATERLGVNANYGYTYAVFTDYATNEKNGGGGTEETRYDGHYVPFVPKHTFAVGAEYAFPLRRNLWLDRISVSAAYKAAGRIYWTEKNDVSQHLYGTLNGRVSLEKGSGQIGFWIDNALNTQYRSFYFETMERGFAQQGHPLQIGVDLRCRF